MNKVWAGVAVLAVLAGGAGYFYKAGKANPDATAALPGTVASASAPQVPASGPGGAGPGAGGGGPPVSVSTVRAEKRDQAVMLEANGSVTPLNIVDIRPQVASVIAKVHVREGQSVKAGELLFTLDNRADQVNVAKAQAQLEKDNAALADAKRQLARSQDLFRQQFVSQSAVDTSLTLVETQQAVVAASKAALQATQVSLGYNRITAPSAGRVGAINVYPGTYVQPGGAVLLTITQLDPIAVAFSLPQRNVNDALRLLRGDAGAGAGAGKVGQVTVQLPDSNAVLTGKLQFVDSAVDAASGSVRVKAVFDNKDSKLWPGVYVNVRLAVQELKDAVVVPQAAIITGQRDKSVYVVEAGNKAAQRRVEVVYAAGANAVVTGVNAGDRVVVDGRQNLRPGATVVERPAGDGARAGGGPAVRGASGPQGAVRPPTDGAPASTP
jgi:RND family efflux transporter MFP subunit